MARNDKENIGVNTHGTTECFADDIDRIAEKIRICRTLRHNS